MICRRFPPECYEAAGWTASTIERARSFFFLDSDISTESIEALLVALEATDGAAANRQSIAETLNTAVHGSTAFLWALGLTAVLWVLCLVGAAVQKERRAALLIPLLLGALLEVALILYLAIQGRMPTRVLWLVFLPFMALVAGLLPSCIPAGSTPLRPCGRNGGALLWGAVRLWADARRGHTAFAARY